MAGGELIVVDGPRGRVKALESDGRQVTPCRHGQLEGVGRDQWLQCSVRPA